MPKDYGNWDDRQHLKKHQKVIFDNKEFFFVRYLDTARTRVAARLVGAGGTFASRAVCLPVNKLEIC